VGFTTPALSANRLSVDGAALMAVGGEAPSCGERATDFPLGMDPSMPCVVGPLEGRKGRRWGVTEDCILYEPYRLLGGIEEEW
jgi:hypothetical protein